MNSRCQIEYTLVSSEIQQKNAKKLVGNQDMVKGLYLHQFLQRINYMIELSVSM